MKIEKQFLKLLRDRDFRGVVKMLKAHKIDMTDKAITKEAGILAKNYYYNFVEVLLKCGLDVNCEEIKKATKSYYWHDNVEGLDFLIKYGFLMDEITAKKYSILIDNNKQNV